MSALANFHLQAAEIQTVRYLSPESNTDHRDVYFVELLKLALDKTAEQYGPVELIEAKLGMTQGRALESLKRREFINVFWTMTSRERETNLLPIRIPLLRGLLSHRVFHIRESDLEKFGAINTLEDLSRYRAVQGHDWPDTEILRANGLSVTTAAFYSGMFDMVLANRVDYFPRGINEVWDESARYADSELIVEPSIMLRYRAPIYYFVHPDDTALADRIEKGLRMAMEDGSFDEFYFHHPLNSIIFENIAKGSWRIFDLENPLLTEDTPVEDSTLWFDIETAMRSR
ncbi:MAG: hypothetical protein MJA83_17050 [Gammaproteobacteria bacterium]|nr:hypothetical protein [Gammaproteobacteria bacterium]